MTQAALGADVEIPTLEGAERSELEPGTEAGTVIRLRGKGIPNARTARPGRPVRDRGGGDARARSKEERALLERLAELRTRRLGKDRGLVGKLRKLLEA